MKRILTTVGLFTAILSTQAFASNSNSCGLPEYFDTNTVRTAREVQPQKKVELDTVLSKSENLQLLILARHYNKTFDNLQDIKNLSDAKSYLLDSSESSDVFVGQHNIQGKEYSTILFYPGGNLFGMIFQKDTTNVIAYINDTEIQCK